LIRRRVLAADKKKEDEKKDDPKAGADIGKTVDLMAGDANRVRGLRFEFSRYRALSR
jgi:hypothetical protein